MILKNKDFLYSIALSGLIWLFNILLIRWINPVDPRSLSEIIFALSLSPFVLLLFYGLPWELQGRIHLNDNQELNNQIKIKFDSFYVIVLIFGVSILLLLKVLFNFNYWLFFFLTGNLFTYRIRNTINYIYSKEKFYFKGRIFDLYSIVCLYILFGFKLVYKYDLISFSILYLISLLAIDIFIHGRIKFTLPLKSFWESIGNSKSFNFQGIASIIIWNTDLIIIKFLYPENNDWIVNYSGILRIFSPILLVNSVIISTTYFGKYSKKNINKYLAILVLITSILLILFDNLVFVEFLKLSKQFPYKTVTIFYGIFILFTSLNYRLNLNAGMNLKRKSIAYINIFEALFNFLISIILAHSIGLIGIPVGSAVGAILSYTLWQKVNFKDG